PYTGRLGILTAEDERKVDEALRAVRAEELGPKDFNAISDGQKQRVLLARAFCQEPDILVLDEPTSFLDVRHKLDLLSILKNMAEKNGITVILSLHEIDLAMKISDKILCVKGDRIFAYGTPDEIFREDRIRDLYDIDNGFFDPLFGSIELPRITGEPEVFVISSGGTGIPVYRRLQKERKAFACGPLWTNDVDYRLAQLLAAEIVTVEPFCPLSGEIVEKAKEMMDRCGCVINAGVEIGPGNEAVRELLSYAKEKGYLVI
ncbi:MAG: ABC transporter ATP-binding protein, partial [Eubacterium sp.]|nr:ABC transporter ATP-binding protein [Eubacterium sp.]